MGSIAHPHGPPPRELRRHPGPAAVIPGGSPRNPMGAAALTLAGDRYAIHGTNRPSSIGTFASAGCVRMLNEDVLELFDKVSIGTPVVVEVSMAGKFLCLLLGAVFPLATVGWLLLN